MNDHTLFLNDISSDIDNQMKLNINSNVSLQCKISPMVIMSILNHYQRRPSSNQQIKYPSFVLGLLFGRKDGDKNSIIINDSFGLESHLNPASNTIAVNQDSAHLTIKLHSMSHPNDRLVGWYRTGLQIEPTSKAIHEQIVIKKLSPFSNKLSKLAGIELNSSEYIHLLIDTLLVNDKLSIKAFTMECINDPLEVIEYDNYIKEKKKRERIKKAKINQINQKNKAKQKKKQLAQAQQKKDKDKDNDNDDDVNANTNKDKDVNQLSAQAVAIAKIDNTLPPLKKVEPPYPIFFRFIEIPTEYLASESEKIGIDMIIEGQPEGNDLDSPSMLMNDTNHLEQILQSLLQNLEIVENYVASVVDGTINGNESLGWLIGEALCSVPNVSPIKFEQMLSNRLQDFLMLIYLGKMTKFQLTVADKINKVLPATMPKFTQPKTNQDKK